jgi:uncharacterized protein YecE (DUF72 family)
MLKFYATRLPTVEINNTFYRMPNAATLENWRSQVPETFRFAVKAPRRISHIKRLKDCGGELRYLLDALRAMEPCVGSILFQLPPFAKRDVGTLESFVAELPHGCRAAFEFRNASWFDPAVYDVLRSRNLALVQSEEATPLAEPITWTASWAYLRLRRVEYTQDDLETWLARLRAANLEEAQVFFKHEDKATGPKLAEQFLALAARATR